MNFILWPHLLVFPQNALNASQFSLYIKVDTFYLPSIFAAIIYLWIFVTKRIHRQKTSSGHNIPTAGTLLYYDFITSKVFISGGHTFRNFLWKFRSIYMKTFATKSLSVPFHKKKHLNLRNVVETTSYSLQAARFSKGKRHLFGFVKDSARRKVFKTSNTNKPYTLDTNLFWTYAIPLYALKQKEFPK